MKKITILAHNHPDILTEPFDTTNLQLDDDYQNFIPELLQSTKFKVNLVEGDSKDVDEDAMIIYIPVYDIYSNDLGDFSTGKQAIKNSFYNLPEKVIRRIILANKNNVFKSILLMKYKIEDKLLFDMAGSIFDKALRENKPILIGHKVVGIKINAILDESVHKMVKNMTGLSSNKHTTLVPFLLEYIDAYMDIYL